MHGGQRAHCCGKAGLVVAHVGAGDDGRAVREGVQRHPVGQQPALASRMEDREVAGPVIGVRPGAAEGRYGGDDDLRIGGIQCSAVEPSLGRVRRGIVVHHHVHSGYQTAQQVLALRVFHVQGDASFPRIEVQEQPAAFLVGNVIRERAATP